ncbi:MAG: formimidoylglutamate deiminase [Thiotrichales bacterium]|nr:formimidoylglutamate deiminase [Thiotrichales bacterium]
MRKGEILWAEQALTTDGWQREVRIELGADGRIAAVESGCSAQGCPPQGHPPQGHLAQGDHTRGRQVGILLPAPVNLHSHAFQRAMAGLTERRGPDPRDSFWTWRRLMYRFLERLGPDELESIAAFAQMQMLEAGFAAVAEFHYVHHQPDGASYDRLSELSMRIVAAAAQTGIGLTLLPVLYRYGGCDGKPLEGVQHRFGNSPEDFARLREEAGAAVRGLDADARIGVAIHSLRAVDPEGLAFAAALAPQDPVHIHVAEQTAEVEEVEACLGARPVQWLLANVGVDARWCLVHATHITPGETAALAASGAVAGLCPITEASLGDGIFDGANHQAQGGRFGVGTDSNIRISLAEELRMLEYSQRLRDRARAVLAPLGESTGRTLFEAAARGGAQAAMRDAGSLAPGCLADLVALDAQAVDLAGKRGDALLDSFIFTGGDAVITDVWSAGRHVVEEGRHVRHDAITARYVRTIGILGEML